MKADALHTIVQVARLYYEQDLSQQEIADKLGVSQSSIAKYLIQAREQGVVEIRVVDPSESSDMLARAIREQYRLDFAAVVPGSHKSLTLTLQAVGHVAAKYLAEHIDDAAILGIAWGRSTQSFADQLSAQDIDKADVSVVPLMGESSNERIHTRMNQLVEQCSEKIRATPHFLFYPMIVDSKALYNRIMEEEAVKKIANLWGSLDWVFMGIGVLPPTPGMNIYIPEALLPELAQKKVVGDICCRYFDVEGHIVQSSFADRIVAVGAEHLKRTKRVIGIAAGAEKEKALRGALKTGLFSHIFIDQELASRVVD